MPREMFVAFDGTSFDSYDEANAYEKKKYHQWLATGPMISVRDYLNVLREPTGGQVQTDMFSYFVEKRSNVQEAKHGNS